MFRNRQRNHVAATTRIRTQQTTAPVTTTRKLRNRTIAVRAVKTKQKARQQQMKRSRMIHRPAHGYPTTLEDLLRYYGKFLTFPTNLTVLPL